MKEQLAGEQTRALEVGAAPHQRLADHGTEAVGEAGAGLILLVTSDRVHEAVDGGVAAGGVDGAKDEMAGLGGGEGQLDGLAIAQLADDDDIRVFAQRRLQRPGVASCVGAELALLHEGELVTVHDLDRILDGDDVARLGAVDGIDEGRQRRRLARRGRPADEHQTGAQPQEVLHGGRQAEPVEHGDLGAHGAKHRRQATALPEEVGAHALPAALHGEGEVDVALLVEALGHLGRDEGREQRGHPIRRERVRRQRLDLTVPLHEERTLGGHDEVVAAGLEQAHEELVEGTTVDVDGAADRTTGLGRGHDGVALAGGLHDPPTHEEGAGEALHRGIGVAGEGLDEGRIGGTGRRG